MSNLTVSEFLPALKPIFANRGEIEDEVYKDNPFLAMVPREEQYGGDGEWRIPIKYVNPNGRSATFSKAQDNAKGSKRAGFKVQRARDYAIAYIDGELILASRDNKAALADALTEEIEGAIEALMRSTAIKLWRAGTGSIGRLDGLTAVASTGPFTLTNTAEIVNFEKGMVLTFSSADGSGARTGTATIATIDRDLGQFTLDAALNSTVSSPGVSDYIQVDGDYNAGITGVDGWNPTGTVTSTPFWQVDRTVDVTRLAGVRLDLQGKPIEESSIKLLTRVCREGGRPDFMFYGPDRWEDMEMSIGSKRQYVDVEVGNVGFTGIKLNSPKGSVTALSDPNLPPNVIRAIQLSTWKFKTLGEWGQVIDLDGLRMSRQLDGDGYELRIGGYGNLGCKAIGRNGVALVSVS